jgi:cation:H+ antiporter
MVWLQFVLSAALIVVAAHYLAKSGDIIAARTRLGGMFVGILLLAGATSLPELLTSISSVQLGQPDLAAGNLLGSNAFNMLMLAVLDLLHRSQRILRSAAKRHALTGSLAVLMIGLVLYFIVADIEIKIGWVGLDALVILVTYIAAVRLIATDSQIEQVHELETPEDTPRLWVGLAGFAATAGALLVITPYLVEASAEIAVLTGLGATFIGTTLLALVTSLPEVVTTVAAIRLGAHDMAIGNLFGSNMFNMAALGLTDLFYTQGRLIGVIDPAFVLIGTFGLLMTVVGLIGNVARLERRLLFIEIDSLVLILLYLAGMFLLYQRGMG